MHKKKTYKAVLNFSKEELSGRLALGASGVSMPLMGREQMEDYSTEFLGRNTTQFGMLGNDPKFYGDVEGDTNPKPEDFLEVPFRLLSATIVGAGTWKATDFTDANMLRASTEKLNGVPLYKDHETDINNWVGVVNGVKWTDSFTDSTGVRVPAGIDGIVAIDKVTNPKVARGVQMGAIFSNSVTVAFEWEMSHAFEDEYSFYNAIGTLGPDGKMIRRVVTEINDYHESSLVWLGADPFAKAITPDGGLKNIDISSVYSFAKSSYHKTHKLDTKPEKSPENVKETKSITINFALDQNVLSLAKRGKVQDKNEPKTKSMKNFIAAFILAFGKQFELKAGDAPTEEQMIGYLDQLGFSSDSIVQANQENARRASMFNDLALSAFRSVEGNEQATEVDLTQFAQDFSFAQNTVVSGLEDQVSQLTADADKMKLNADLGKKYLGLKRDEALRLYKLSAGTNVDEAVVGLFGKANDEEIEGLLKQYVKNATGKFSGVCGDCGSQKFSFQSSLTAGEQGGDGVIGDVAAFSLDEAYAERSQGSMRIGRRADQ